MELAAEYTSERLAQAEKKKAWPDELEGIVNEQDQFSVKPQGITELQ